MRHVSISCHAGQSSTLILFRCTKRSKVTYPGISARSHGALSRTGRRQIVARPRDYGVNWKIGTVPSIEGERWLVTRQAKRAALAEALGTLGPPLQTGFQSVNVHLMDACAGLAGAELLIALLDIRLPTLRGTAIAKSLYK
jgi:hypothetical protein